ncbi:MAG: translation initiation factor [Vicinamibacterales bacterium]
MKHNPFEALRSQLGLPKSVAEDAVQGPQPTTAELRSSNLEPRTPGAASAPGRAVVRMERSGRGGKEATVVEQLGLPQGELDVWLKALKASLGCGGSVEGGSLMLQGDHRKRLPAVLKERGVRKVIIG